MLCIHAAPGDGHHIASAFKNVSESVCVLVYQWDDLSMNIECVDECVTVLCFQRKEV